MSGRRVRQPVLLGLPRLRRDKKAITDGGIIDVPDCRYGISRREPAGTRIY